MCRRQLHGLTSSPRPNGQYSMRLNQLTPSAADRTRALLAARLAWGLWAAEAQAK